MLSERKTLLISMQPKTEVLFQQPEPLYINPHPATVGHTGLRMWIHTPKVRNHVIPQKETE